MTTPAEAAFPTELARLPQTSIAEIDVRPLVASGGSPCDVVQEIPTRLPEGGAVRLRVPFEPVPLYGAMAGLGLHHWTQRHAHNDWEVWFWRAETGSSPGAAEASSSCGCAAGGSVSSDAVVDVRGLAPPEPMQRTLEVLERLPAGASLIQKVDRVPRFLLPVLEERGYSWTVLHEGEDGVEMRITPAR